MKRGIGFALIAGGIFLLFFGWNEYQSMASEVSEMFTGSPTDNAVWYLVGGAAAVAGGAFLALSGKKEF